MDQTEKQERLQAMLEKALRPLVDRMESMENEIQDIKNMLQKTDQ
ncbi:hypothetical protein GCM10007416_35300 [Kroppenstedtia guangzhouensis]|jgi:uncharacterized protein (UPF0335 family)|uniref:Uncharacterized protein n=1 Tax=Kroppenstedtia guangzhouensis TaxID=1274356 RepID=A0ABQ1H591_9BACL|nr:hypothetical protein [Kroppenstedtia guangzhouensis]GGA59125.1 hypothetical protein GCM10007416_35300 [Kroppenstedtia guangzhouensis]